MGEKRWSDRSSSAAPFGPPGRPLSLSGPLEEIDRWEWYAGAAGENGDLRTGLASFLATHGLAQPYPQTALSDGSRQPVDGRGVGLLLGAFACGVLAGWAGGAPSPVPDVPDAVAVAYRAGPNTDPDPTVPTDRSGEVTTGEWRTTWSDDEHALAVETVREAIARGELYQANVVGHRSARHRCRPADVARAAAGVPGAAYAGVLLGEGWAVGSASPEQLVRVEGRRVTTVPIKGTRVVAPGSDDELRASAKDRAEHIMIVDLERNDLSRIARTGSVVVERLYDVERWAGLWHAGSVVAAELLDGVSPLDVLAALAPGGSVTGAPKRAACALLADLEPVGRGPSMGAFGFLWPGGMDLGLSIRTVAVDQDRVHLWAGGGITWGSDAAQEVEEAHAKAGPVMRRLGRRSGSRLGPAR